MGGVVLLSLPGGTIDPMARRRTLRSQLYRTARDLGNVRAAVRGPGLRRDVGRGGRCHAPRADAPPRTPTHTAALRYQHATSDRHREVTDKLGALLNAPAKDDDEGAEVVEIAPR